MKKTEQGQNMKSEKQEPATVTDRKAMLEAFFLDKEYRPMRIKTMAAVLSVPKEDREEFRRLLEELVAEGRIYADARGCYRVRKGEVVTGTFSGTARGFGFVVPENAESGGDIFIPERETKGALHGDLVQAQITEADGAGKRREGTIVKIIRHANEYVVGTYEKAKNCGFVIPDNPKFGSDVFISREHSKGAVSGHKVYVKITDFGNERKHPEGRVMEILGHINDPSSDLDTVLKTYGLSAEFPEEVMQQIEEIPEELTEAVISEELKKGRLDLRGELTVTIDGEDAKDLDDAITISKENGRYRLGVHIADVTHYVREQSPLDCCALKRGTSVYLINKVIPMLPHKLSNGICSLNAGTDRLALSCLMELDENGKLLGYRIAESVIRVTRRMSYTEVERILTEAPKNQDAFALEYGELLPKFPLMQELSELLRERRRKRGALDFDFDESKILLDNAGRPLEIKPYERNRATRLIEDFMLAANETIAENFYWQEVPFVYRIHEKPDEEKLKKLKVFCQNFGFPMKIAQDGVHPKELQKLLEKIDGTPEEALIARLTLRSMKQAKYTTDCEGHFGLAASYYCHFTSPIRRYPDLQIHRIIKENLHGTLTEERKAHYRQILPEVAAQSSRTERTAEEAERDVEKLKKVEYMAERLGEVYEGMVSGLTNWGIYVELPNTIEGVIPLADLTDDFYVYDEERYTLIGERFHKTYRLGQHITVQVVAADKLEKRIDFLPAQR